MLRQGAGSGILMGAILCAVGGALYALGARDHGPSGAQIIYVGVVVTGALRLLVALIPERRAGRRFNGQPRSPGAVPTEPPVADISFAPVRAVAGRCWDCGSRVRPDSAICFRCGAAQVNGYQRATGRPASSATSGPAPEQGEYPRYEPARPY